MKVIKEKKKKNMEINEAIEKLQAYLLCEKSKCGGRFTCPVEGCCECELNYDQGNWGEHIQSVEVILNAIKEKENNRWVSVTERLPKAYSLFKTPDNENPYYLVQRENGLYNVATYEHFDTDVWSVNGYCYEDIVKWKPLEYCL